LKNQMLFFMTPDPGGDNIRIVGDFLRKLGISLSFQDSKIFLMENVKDIIYERGITSLLSMQLLTEEVLSDLSPRNKIVDILKYKLSQIIPTNSLLIIDSYLFPKETDSDYETFFMSIFHDTIKTCRELFIVTREDRDKSIETKIITSIKILNPSIVITTK